MGSKSTRISTNENVESGGPDLTADRDEEEEEDENETIQSWGVWQGKNHQIPVDRRAAVLKGKEDENQTHNFAPDCCHVYAVRHTRIRHR